MDTHTDFKGQTTAYAYDNSASGQGRLIGEYYFATAGAVPADQADWLGESLSATTYDYTPLGQRLHVTDFVSAR